MQYIIAGWSYSTPDNWGWADELRTPDRKAVLHILADRDPWFARPGWRRYDTENRPWVRELILDSDGHYVYRNVRARKAVEEFLDGILRSQGSILESSGKAVSHR